MIIDNKNPHTRGYGAGYRTAWDFIKSKIEGQRNGEFNIVTGYFTIGALAELAKIVKDGDHKIRIVSSEMVKGRDDMAEHIVDLLNGDLSSANVFTQQENARIAKEFLLRRDVEVKAITNAFCHAKAYIFHQNNPNSFFHLMGSCNLTEAGLGLRESSNIELATANSSADEYNDFVDLQKWFEDDIWPKAADKVPDPDAPRSLRNAPKITVKEYFLRLIDNYYKEYSPEQIYYKILFELFSTEIDIDGGLENEKDMGLLRNSVIWNTLYPYQQQGVISLVKMLRRHNGAILADAVGLGKTFSALAVMKFFQTQGYKIVLLCPKKLEQNWAQYLRHRGSRFENDAFDYAVRFHTDLQNDRLSTAYQDYHPEYLATQPKVLYVIDESHNLRNSKSSRYKDLMETLIKPNTGDDADQRDVKVLMLSATPINTGFNDIYGQFNIIAKGTDEAFDNDEFGIPHLANLFMSINKEYKQWCEQPNRTISGFIHKIKPEFFNLTDKLLVARTRKIIEQSLDIDLKFPEKEAPKNIYVSLEHFGMLHSASDIYDTFDALHLTAYQPSLYMTAIPAPEDANAPKLRWDDNVFREKFLVKMMGILLLKRLESSWFACKLTIDKILEIHEQTLDKVKRFMEQGGAADIDIPVGEEIDDEEDNTQLDEEFALRGGQINLRKMKNIEGFRRDLKADVEKLSLLAFNMKRFEDEYRAGRQKDEKLDKLVEILNEKKRNRTNKKVVIFTAYADTAAYLFDELKSRGFRHLAMASGTEIRTTGNHSTNNFTEILQSFAPYSKLFMERQWDDLYRRAGLNRNELYDNIHKRWNVTYETWLDCVKRTDDGVRRLVDDKIDILIATDCLSEGQNLQDADMQINYDIHWNPVRLIQRFGRIDRIGSPNKKIRSVNFWPSNSVDSYLKLESRIQNRMSIMNVTGTETIDLNEQYRKIVDENPIQDRNADKLLRQLSENSVADIEGDDNASGEGGESLSLSDFSLEIFRQDLIDYFERNKDEFRRMPCGIFSGFTINAADSSARMGMPDSLVAVLGYPKRDPADKGKTPYQQVRIICQPVGGEAQSLTLNKPDILGLLRANRKKPRQVPLWIDHPSVESSDKMTALQEALKSFFNQHIQTETHSNLMQLFGNGRGKTRKATTEQPSDLQRVEDRFKPENYDLVVWEYISRVGAATPNK